MPVPQAAEDNISYSDFLVLVTGGEFDWIQWGPAYSTGTRVFAKIGEVWRAYLITDLTAPSLQSAEVSYGNLITTSVNFVSTGKGVGPITPSSTIFMWTDPFIEATSIPAGNPRLDLQLYVSTIGIPASGVAPPGGDVGQGIFNNDADIQSVGQSSNFVHSSAQNKKIFVYLAWRSEVASTTWNILNGRLLVLYK